jgi:hypothetical protein
LLYFLSLLPSGVTLEQLRVMWSGEVENSIKVIKLYEFLDLGFGEKFIVLPFVINFLQETVSEKDKEGFVKKICTYYGGLLRRLFQIISLD